MANLLIAPGSLFANRFEIERPAGSGGMGTVYRARDRYSGELVALKLLHAGPGGADEAERFAREAQLLSELRHPGIVTYIAHGTALDGQLFLAMEWLEGHDLATHLRHGPLSPHNSIALLRAIAEPLSQAHQLGVVHRDLKPANFFLVDGRIDHVKLLDFGIARRLSGGCSLTQTGAAIGTPQYMSPEQARGLRELSPASDLFAIGCVLYECLTGQPPFAGEHGAAVLVRILLEEPEPITARLPGIPFQISTLLQRLLAKDPLQRPRDAAALLTELDALAGVTTAISAKAANPPQARRHLTDTEQRLMCVVMASHPRERETAGLASGGDDEEAATGSVEMGQEQAVGDRQRELQQALESLGAQVEWLMDGSLVATVSGHPTMGSSAADQVLQAARCALAIKRLWPRSEVALGTGRGLLRHQLPTGEAVERAVKLLRAHTGEKPQGGSMAGVWLDELSSKLLAGRFTQTLQPDGALLFSEEKEVDASRPLLGKPTPCVGRDAELGNLEGLLSSCIEESEARVALITAPPGIGKSRLRHEVLRRVEKRSDAVTVLLGRGDMMSAGAPYGILVAAIRRLCGLNEWEPIRSQQQLLRERIARHITAPDQERVVLFIGELCGILFPDSGMPMLQAARRDPKLMRDCMCNALIDWLAAECASAPVLLVLDDLQWGDTLTVSVIEELLRAQKEARLFVLAFARPEVHQTFPKLWQSHKMQELQLKGLSKKACERLIQQVLGKDASPKLLAYAVEQSAGNALFLEEIIRSLADGKLEGQPATVLAMLQARIGRLEVGARRAVRAASVFGQTFWAGGVTMILGLPKSSIEVDYWLTALSDAELIQPHAKTWLAGEKAYEFRHGLVREAAYSLLTDSDLATGHHLAAEFLERFGSEDLVVIAEHYHRGGDMMGALPFFIRSAQQSFDRYDLTEMQRLADRGVACGAQGEQLGVLRALQFHAATGNSDWPRALTLGAEALERLAAGSPSWCRLIGLWGGILCFTGQADRAIVTARSFVYTQPASEARITYLYSAMYFVILFCQGGLCAAANMVLERMEQVAAEAEQDDVHIRAPMQFSRATYLRSFQPDPWRQIAAAREAAAAYRQTGNLREACICEYMVGEMQAEAGDSASGEASLRDSLALALRLDQENLLTSGRLHLAAILAGRKDPRVVLEALDFLGKVLEFPGLSVGFRGWAHGIQAQILSIQGRYREAEVEARRSLELSQIAPLRRLLSLVTLVSILLQQARPDEACVLAEEGLKQAESMGGGGYSELPLRLAVAEARYSMGDPQGAAAAVHAANNELKRRAALIDEPAARGQYPFG